MPNQQQYLNNIADGRPVRIFLPLQNRQERLRAQCIYQRTDPPSFVLVFKAGVLPVDDIDVKQPCIVTIDMGGPTISLEAMIQKMDDPQILQMIVRKSVSHEQMREFFRVDAVTKVISSAFLTQFSDENSEPWSVQGTTIDISGSGLLAVFPTLPPPDKQVTLEITIPTENPETIKVVAHLVRTNRLPDNRYEIAYHFDDISVEDRDKLIGCCLVLQRRLLRLKVQIQKPQ